MQNAVVQSSKNPRAVLASMPGQSVAISNHKTAVAAPPKRKNEIALPFNAPQRAALRMLDLALKEGHVFAALTGVPNSGKTFVLNAILKVHQSAGTVCVHIPRPDRISGEIIAEIESSITDLRTTEATRDKHIVLAIDNAHTMSDELLLLLNRFVKARGCDRSPQIIFVGRPEFWDRISSEAYDALNSRLAIRSRLNQPAEALRGT